MPLPSLPLDIWHRISSLLPPSSLSSLALVSHALSEICLDNAHFLRHLPHPSAIPPAQHFRRIAALHHPPSNVSSTPLSTKLNILCVTSDTLLLLDTRQQRLLSFPSGHTIPADAVLQRPRPRAWHTLLNHLEDRVLPLPNGLVAFASGCNAARLAVLDPVSGCVHTHRLRRRTKPNVPIVNGRSLLAAGARAEWLLYRVDDSTFQIMDWRTGSMVREIEAAGDVKFLLGECREVDHATVVGVVVKESHGSVTEILARGFDGVTMTFRVDEERVVHSVLRSADTRTHVLITATGAGRLKPSAFVAHRRGEQGDRWWNGSFKGVAYPELRENGRVIALSRQPFLRKRCACRTPVWQLWILLKDDGGTWGSPEEMTVTTREPLWALRTRDGGFAVVAGNDGVEFLRLSREGGEAKQECLRRWDIHGLVNLCVVADHFIVATSSEVTDGSVERKLHLLHFDKFCSGAKGAYACPLRGLVTYCYFPDDFREDEVSHEQKRRRIDEGQASAE